LKEQLNIKLTPEQTELLEAAQFVRGLDSRLELVRPPLEKLFGQLEADIDVVAMLAERRRRREAAEKQGEAEVRKIDAGRRPRKKGARRSP